MFIRKKAPQNRTGLFCGADYLQFDANKRATVDAIAIFLFHRNRHGNRNNYA